MRLRKAFLWSMIVSLCLAALLGIAALLLPSWARYDDEILISTLLFGLYSLLALCCAIVTEKRRLVGWMWIGIAAAAATLSIWLVMLWFDSSLHSQVDEQLAKTAGSFTTISVLIAQCGLLILPRLDGPLAGFVRKATIVVSIALACTLIITYWWFEWIDNYIDDDILWRGMGVLGILTACGTVVTPIIWKVQAVHRVDSAVPIPSRLHIDIKCPRCHMQQELLAGPSKCATCGLRITVQVEEPRCTCGYQLYRLESERCPECGREVPEADRWAAHATDGRARQGDESPDQSVG
ncbi:MAG: hypothetical protein V3T53_12150 [Phycisphaerales bacterium]